MINPSSGVHFVLVLASLLPAASTFGGGEEENVVATTPHFAFYSDFATNLNDALVSSNPRLAYKAEKYAIGMPKFSGKTPGYEGKTDEATLRALAHYVLVDIQSPAD